MGLEGKWATTDRERNRGNEIFEAERDDKRLPSLLKLHPTNLISTSSLVEELVRRESLGLDQEARRRRRPMRGEGVWEEHPLSSGNSGVFLRRGACLSSGAEA